MNRKVNSQVLLGKSGTYKFEVKVTDKNKAIATKSYTIKIIAPSITGTLSDGVIKASYSKTLKATDGTAPYTWTKSSGTLPTGLTLNKSTGKLSGVPSKADKFTFKIKLTDKNKATATKSYTVTITSPSISGTLKAGTVSKSYSGTLKASGGTASYTWTISKGSLPSGLTLNKSKGTITGTPKKAAKYSFTVKITDKNKVTATKIYTITVKAASSGAVKTYSGQYEELYESESDDMNLNTEGKNLTSYEQNVTLNVKPVESHTYFVTELHVMSDDVLFQGTERDEDIVSVRANEPVRFILGTWPHEVSYETVCIDDEAHEEIEIHESTFIIPTELVHDDFKVYVKAKTVEGEYKLKSEELYISAEE